MSAQLQLHILAVEGPQGDLSFQYAASKDEATSLARELNIDEETLTRSTLEVPLEPKGLAAFLTEWAHFCCVCDGERLAHLPTATDGRGLWRGTLVDQDGERSHVWFATAIEMDAFKHAQESQPLVAVENIVAVAVPTNPQGLAAFLSIHGIGPCDC